MSLEIRAGWGCPHLIIEEPVSLSSDGKSLITRGPVSGAGSVRILANDNQYIPQAGLKSSANLVSSSSGPYKILRCTLETGPDGDLLTVSTPTGSASVRLPTGDSVTVERIVRALRLSGVNDLVRVSTVNEALSLEDSNTSGTDSFVRVSGEGADALGFLQKGARGASVYPAWDLLAQQSVYPSGLPSGVVLVPARYPVFRSPLRGNPTLKVTYVSMPERCPRCAGTGTENDWRFDARGDTLLVQNEDLLYQACLKSILTVLGSNPYHPQYGSRLTTRIGGKSLGSAASLIREDVSQALQNVKNLQGGQRKYQNVTSKELLRSVDSIDVRPSSEDPTAFFVDVVVRNGSNEPVSLSTYFTVPGTVSLSGSNGTVLGSTGTSSTRRILLDG